MWVGYHLSKAGKGGMACLDRATQRRTRLSSLPHALVGGGDLSHGRGYFGTLCVAGFSVHPTSCQWVRGPWLVHGCEG